MSSTLALSALLARMSRDELLCLVRSRRVPSPTGISDPLGLAIEYLRADSITRAISHLDCETLRAILEDNLSVSQHPVTPVLRERGLVGWDENTEAFVPLQEVQAALTVALQAAGITAEQLTPHSAAPIEPVAASTGWFGQAVAAVRISTALLRTLRAEPAKMNRKGLVAATAVRSLAEQLRLDATLVTSLLAALEWAGLAAGVADTPSATAPQRLVPTIASDVWLTQGYADRWVQLAQGLRSAITPEITSELHRCHGHFAGATGEALLSHYPLLPDATVEHAARLSRTAEALGATVGGWCAPPLQALLNDDPELAIAIAHADIPAATAGVYLQPDLTLIASGPLRPDVENTLFSLTEIDQLGAAAVLRVTQRSLERALRNGFTTHSIRDFLTEVSLTGVPQPLAFILTDLERDRPMLQRAPGHATSWITRQDPTPNHAAEASHAAETGSLLIPELPVAAGSVNAVETALSAPQLELVDRVFAAAHLAPGGGDLSRVLELAIRDRSMVQVTAAAGSDKRTFTLLPLAVTGGRLRATDQIAGVERTLPLTAITAVVPA